MDIIYEIRRRHLVQKQTITEIARDMDLSRPTALFTAWLIGAMSAETEALRQLNAPMPSAEPMPWVRALPAVSLTSLLASHQSTL